MAPPLAGRRDRGAAVLAAALVVVLSAPWLQAWLAPPPGRQFAGTFFFQDDHFQYLSFVEQAARGEWLFVNKFDPAPQHPFLLNVGWLLAGRLARLTRAPLELAWFAWGLAAAVFLLLGIRRLLALNGLDGAARNWGTLLVLLGGGLGWLRLAAGSPGPEGADLSFGFFPWLQILAGAHGTFGTALLVWTTALYVAWRRGEAAEWPWVVAGSALGLARPFDLGTFVLLAALASLALPRRLRAWPELAWLSPVLFYDALAFTLHPSFATWAGGQNRVPLPGPAALGWALGPAVVLAALALALGRVERTLRVVSASWILLAGALLFSGLGFASQFATSLGAALLAAAALGAPRRLLPVLAAATCPSALVLYWRVLHPAPEWFPPRDYLEATRALAASCRPGEVVYAPSDPSLIAAAFTPCHTAFGHRVLTPRYEQRARESIVFFAETTPPAWRRDYLEQLRARYAMIPVGRGYWLAGSRFGPRWRSPLLEIWEREPR